MAYTAVSGLDGTVTSFIALTTTFSAPSSCSNIFSQEASVVAFDPGYGISVNDDVICQPQAVTTWWQQAYLGVVSSDRTVVSLGPVTCPLGFSTAASYSANSLTTQIMCCPVGYDLENYTPGTTVYGRCLSSVSRGQRITVGSRLGDGYGATEVITTITQASSAGAVGIVGWNIKQAVAPETATVSTMTTSITSPNLSSGISILTTMNTAASSTASGVARTSTGDAVTSDGLSTGAKAGIGVGAGVGAVLLVLLGMLIWMLRRRRKQPPSVPMPTDGAWQHDARKQTDLPEKRIIL